MESDSESLDSDDGRRFRFETTRKDGQSRRQVTPERDSGRRRSRSRDRNQRDERSTASRRGRSSPEDRRDRRSHRAKESREPRQESRNGREHRHKASKRDKHKRRSREKSPEERKKEDRESTPAQERHSRTASPAVVVPITPSEKDRPPLSTEVEEEVNEAGAYGTSSAGSGTSNPGPPVVSDAMSASRPILVGPGLPPPPARKKPLSFFDRVVNKATRDPDVGLYGPALPLNIEKQVFEQRRESASTHDDNREQAIGPALPPSLDVPMSSKEQQSKHNQNDDQRHDATTDEKDKVVEEADEEMEEEEEEAFGPALPPHLQRQKVVGPMLPANFVQSQNTDAEANLTEQRDNEDEGEEDDDNVMGPLPADHPNAKSSHIQMQLEYRARKVKEKFNDKTGPEKSKREEWMVELPPAHAVALGLGSINRKFKTHEGPDMSDRSMWTDTPADRLRKQREKEENRFVPSQESNKKAKTSSVEVPKDVEEPESLLDIHLKNMKKKKKKMEKEAKESGLPTRRPFDRDVDLQVNRLDDAKKKKIFEKARFLNDRFAPGKI